MQVIEGMLEVECKNYEAGGGDKLLYVGNSGHTLHKRMLEHKQALRSERGSDAEVSEVRTSSLGA